MSTDEEIRAVYDDDIQKLSYLVEMKHGKRPFYGNFKGMRISHNYDYDPSETKEKDSASS